MTVIRRVIRNDGNDESTLVSHCTIFTEEFVTREPRDVSMAVAVLSRIDPTVGPRISMKSVFSYHCSAFCIYGSTDLVYTPGTAMITSLRLVTSLMPNSTTRSSRITTASVSTISALPFLLSFVFSESSMMGFLNK